MLLTLMLVLFGFGILTLLFFVGANFKKYDAIEKGISNIIKFPFDKIKTNKQSV